MISEYSAEALYNSNSSEYSKSKALPFRWVESYNFIKLFKDTMVEAKSPILKVLDLACGDGFYTRKLKSNFPSIDFIGVDISEKMVELAEELSAGTGIKYVHYDASRLQDLEFQAKIESFKGCEDVSVSKAPCADLVCCAYFLNYAKDFDELVNYLLSVSSVLESGGAFIGVNDNPRDDTHWYNQKIFKDTLGMDKSLMSLAETEEQGGRIEGQEIVYSCYNSDGSSMDIINFWIPPTEIARAFESAGFRNFQWIDIEPLPESEIIGVDEKIRDHLRLFSNYQPITCFKAIKG